MAFAVFGPGTLYVTRTDVAAQTPVNIGFVQEFSLDVTYNSKQLYGQNQYPLDVSRSTAKTSGKMKAAMISGIALNSAFYGQAFTGGSMLLAAGEAASIPASTPFTVQVTNHTLFDTDLGVSYALTGLPLVKVAAGSEAQGKYSVTGGTYTFAAADTGLAVKISYAYTAIGGQTMTVANQLIGFTPTLQLDYATTHLGKQLYIRVFQAIISKLSEQFKLEDYMVPEMDFEFFANAAGNVVEYFYPEVG